MKAWQPEIRNGWKTAKEMLSALTKNMYKLLYMLSLTDNFGTVINVFTLVLLTEGIDKTSSTETSGSYFSCWICKRARSSSFTMSSFGHWKKEKVCR